MSRIAVFIMQGCGACHDYLPRFTQIARGYPSLQARVFDVSTAQGNDVANRLGVRATPTTIVDYQDGRMLRRVGALDNADITRLFERAAGK